MDNKDKLNKIKKVAFIYLRQESGEYYLINHLDYSIQRRPQLGLQYLCAVLERRGVKTAIFDQTVSFFDSDRLIKELEEYDLAGFYCSDPQEDKVKTYCKKIKTRLNIPILVGGPSAFTNSTFLDYGSDMVVYGEGELTIQQIVEYYNGERQLNDIRGISYKSGFKVIKTAPQELIKNLDDLPFPDRSKVGINSYYDYFLFGMKQPYITMITSRGCIYRCSFCSSCNIWGNRYRNRGIDNVLMEIEEVVKKYNVKYIAFQDDIFGITNNWIESFCEKLVKRPYKVKWMAIFHPLSLGTDTKKILKLMKRAGCDTLSFGLQSAHPEIEKNINRDSLEPERLKKIIKIANKLGFLTVVGYIFGLPGDTKETIKTTINYSLSCGSILAEYYKLSILKNSQIQREYENSNICELSKQEIEKIAVYASKRFYTKPTTILKIAYFIIKNPGWFVKIRNSIPSILKRVLLYT